MIFCPKRLFNANHTCTFFDRHKHNIGNTKATYQDRKDDIAQGIKSTAVLFGENGHIFVTFCYFIVVLIFGYLGWNSSKSLFSVIIIAMIGICTYIAIRRWDMNSPESSNFYFRQNNTFAIMLFLYLQIF